MQKANKPKYTSISEVVKIIGRNNILTNSFNITAITSTIIAFYLFDTKHLVDYITNLSLNIIPSLLGFSIGAYAILVGLSSPNIIMCIVKQKKEQKKEDTKYNLYQKISATFALNLTIQSICVVLIVLYKTINEIKINNSTIGHIACFNKYKYYYFTKEIIIDLVSFTFYLILIYFCFFSFIILFSTIKNIFSFTQLYNHIINKEIINDKTKNEDVNIK